MRMPLMMTGVSPSLSLDFTQGVQPSALAFSRNSIGTYVGSNGVLQTSAANALRFDYGPVTLACKGGLIEEARTNTCPRSTNFSGLAYNPQSAVITAAATTSPSGIIDGTTIATNQNATIFSTVTNGGVYTNGTVITGSIFIKLISAIANFNFGIYWGHPTSVGGAAQGYTFNSSSGILSSNGANNSIIENYGNGWYRIKCTFTTSQDITAALVYNGFPQSTTVAIWGQQWELGAFATSYIPTVSAAVTRAADLGAVLTGNWYNQNEGTLYVEFMRNVIAPTQATILTLNDGVNSSISIESGNPSTAQHRLNIVSGGVQQALLTPFSAAQPNTVYKFVAAWRNNDFAAVQNGGTLVTSNSGIVPGNMNVLAIPGALNGCIRKMSYTPRRLPNSNLIALAA